MPSRFIGDRGGTEARAAQHRVVNKRARCVETRLKQFGDDITAAEEQSDARIARMHAAWKSRRGLPDSSPVFSGQDARELRQQIHTTLARLGAKLAEFFCRDVDAGADPRDLVENSPECNIGVTFFVNICASYIDEYDVGANQPSAANQSTDADDAEHFAQQQEAANENFARPSVG